MPSRDVDRNLLFGLLALRMELIARDDLIDAVRAWSLEKQRTLGEILIERGGFEATGLVALDAMVEVHIARHGGDPLASLAALSSLGTVVEALRRSVDDPAVLDSLATIAPKPDPWTEPGTSRAAGRPFRADPPVSSGGLTDTYATRPGELDPSGLPSWAVPPPHFGSRYRKVREHAQGGLGVVFVARDSELNREVALKEIKDRHADHPHNRSRFLLEAEVTGGLEHPGIVPVYGLGHHDDGRPFYAMRFIRGDSLTEAIAAFHQSHPISADPGERNLSLQKLLRRFTDVCNAIDYAHSRGILHRDLKPHNVMVGQYGETLVVDWGLAKTISLSGPLDRDGQGPDDSLRPSSSIDEGATVPGTIVGTPAYMSPEQATGRLEELGPASDVYGLGATLYHLLAGRPPFAGPEIHGLLARVEAGQFDRPRQASPWLDPALEAVCLKAMALKPTDRYATPRALAEDVDRWVAGEPVAAYPEPWTRRARRWARRHRTPLITATTASAVALVLLGLFVGNGLVRRQRADLGATAALDQSDRLAIDARKTGDLAVWASAIAEALRARTQLDSGGGSPSLHSLVDARIESLRVEESGRKLDLEVVKQLGDSRMINTNLKNGEFDTEAKQIRLLQVFRSIGIDLATLPVEEAARRIRSSRIADELIAAIDDWNAGPRSNVPAARLAAIALAADTDVERSAIRQAFSQRDLTGLRRFCESEEDRRKLGPRIRPIFRALLKLDPVGNLPLLEQIRQDDPGDFWINEELGMAYGELVPPRYVDQIRCLSAAVALKPDSPGALLNLAGAWIHSGNREAALAALREAIRLEPGYSDAQCSLGNLYKEAGNREEARKAYLEAIRLSPTSSAGYFGLATLDQADGNLVAALASCREAIRLKSARGEFHYLLGDLLAQSGEKTAAISAYREAIARNPNLAGAHFKLAGELFEAGDRSTAIASYREAFRLQPDSIRSFRKQKLAPADRLALTPSVGFFRETARLDPLNAQAHLGLGVALRESGDLVGSLASYFEALRLNPAYFEAQLSIAGMLAMMGKPDAAAVQYRNAIQMRPTDGDLHYGLGLALFELQDWEGAAAEARQTIRFQPDYAEAHCNLGQALQQAGRFREALASLERGDELGSKRPDWKYPSKVWIRNTRRFLELEAKVDAVRKGEAQPANAVEWLVLAQISYKKRLHVLSVQFLEKAFADRPELADDLAIEHRHHAAISAAQAGSGLSVDVPAPDEAARAEFRSKALAWLRADLAGWAGQIGAGQDPARKTGVARNLLSWTSEPGLACLREESSLAKLPETERADFRAFWAEVEALRSKASAP